MQEFCKDEFWNNSVIWNTTDPNFTECFQQTVLAYIPLVVLLCLSPIEVYVWWRKKNQRIGLNLFNIAKFLLTCSLIAACVFEVYLLLQRSSQDSFDAEVLAAFGGATSYIWSLLVLGWSLRQVY